MRRRHFVACLSALLIVSGGLAAAQSTAASRIRVVIDPRIELLTIVFRLAGNVEYSHAEVASYAKDVDAHFGRFKDHPAIVRARELNKTRGISFGDPMILALNVTAPPELAERVPLDPFPGSSSRWTPPEARAFLADLRAFARDADVAGFLAAHDRLYGASTQRLEAMVGQAGVFEWIERFFGRRDDRRFVVATSLLMGSGSFGGLRVPVVPPKAGHPPANAPRAEEYWVVLGAAHADPEGMPIFPANQALTLAHEFSHSFVSPLVKAHLPQLLPSAEKIFPPVENEMQRQAYGPGETIIHESLVRACTVRYAWDHGGAEAGRREAAMERERGFLAVDRLADLLAQYANDRARYRELEDFAPRIVAFFEEYSRLAAQEAAAIREERRAKSEAVNAPKVELLVPPNGAENVEASAVKAITITFDRPMRHMAVVMVPGLAFPKATGRPTYDATSRVLTIPCELEPDTAYGLQLNSEKNMVMTDTQGNFLAPVLWRFRTRK